MLKEFEGNQPDLDEKTFLADGARVIGAVRMKEFSSLWCNAVARGDVNRIEVGRYSNVQDNAVLHAQMTIPAFLAILLLSAIVPWFMALLWKTTA